METRTTPEEDTRIWFITKVPSNPPGLLALTTDGLFLYPNAFDGNFSKILLCNPQWARSSATPPKVCLWRNGYLIALRRISSNADRVHIFHYTDDITLLGIVANPRQTKPVIELMEWQGKAYLAIAGHDGDVAILQIWRIVDELDEFPLVQHVVLGQTTRDCAVSLITVGRTLVAITGSGKAFVWDMSSFSEPPGDPIRLVPPVVRGPIRKAILYPARGSILLLSEGNQCTISEWEIGNTFLED